MSDVSSKQFPANRHAGGARFWTAAAMTLIAVLTSAVFSVAAVIDTSLSGTGAGHLNALYTAARSLPLTVAVIAVILLRSRVGVLTLAFTMTMVQACDAAIGTDLPKTLGPAVLATATLAAFVWLLREPVGT